MFRVSLFRSLFRITKLLILCLLLNLSFATPVVAQPFFTKQFIPDTIATGNISTMIYTITNDTGTPVTDLAFTNTLPAAITIAAVTAASSTCGDAAVLDTPSGGSTITFSDGAVGGLQSCVIQVNVTSTTLGTHTNTTGDLTSSAGNSGTATDDLQVVNSRPGFSKSFSPAAISSGSRSTLTFTIDNSQNASNQFFASFTDNFPEGMTIADPANASTDCLGAIFTAEVGSDVVSMTNGTIFANATCTAIVDVIATGDGTLYNETELFSSPGGPSVSAGKAADTLQVTRETLSFMKVFTDDPVTPGQTVNLEFTISNSDRDNDITNISFTDNLDAALAGLVATGLPLNDVCGVGSTLSGTDELTLIGGVLPSGNSCTFSVILQVPAGAAAGAYNNTTSGISGDLGGSPINGSAASDTLFVRFAPQLTKTFLSNPVGGGEAVSVEYTITNSSATSSVTDVAFEDNLAFLSGVTASAFPTPGFCGAGSFAGTATNNGEEFIFILGANLAAGDSCTFTVDILIPTGAPIGSYVSTTSRISGTVDGEYVEGKTATDTLTVVGAPQLSKSFLDNPALPGDQVQLEYTIEHNATAAADATGITFTDDLNAVITNLAAIDTPLNDICGAGSQISGTTTLSFTGGTLAPGESCSFIVTIQVPAAAIVGSYTSITSNLVATVSGVTTTGGAASDILEVSGLFMTKEFIDNPSFPGEAVTLRFTIDNTVSQSDATAIFFTDDLGRVLTGLTSIILPPQPCGAGSQITGPAFLIFVGGEVAAGDICVFDVTVLIPGGAADGSYGNTTSNLIATVDGTQVTLNPASDALVIDTNRISLQKEFTDDPVTPGGTVTLEFTLTNLDTANTANSIAFTDDLGAALANLTFDSVLSNDCGATITGQGTTLLDFSGGTVAADTSCTVQVSLTVPADALPETAVINTTSEVTGQMDGFSISSTPATDQLEIVQLVDFSQVFNGPAYAGGIARLTFTLTNPNANDVNGLAFTEDLGAALPGLVMVTSPAEPCGENSQITGTSTLNFTGGSLSASGGTCSFEVELLVPASAAAGTYPTTSSDLSTSGLSLADPATADLVIEPPPLFTKVFAPSTTFIGGVSQLTFTIDNTGNSLETNSITFTDNLPAGMTVANQETITNCTGGTITAVPETAVIRYSGGAVAAGSTCTIVTYVTTSAEGLFVNITEDLTSNAGNSGTATDTLTVNFAPGFSKVFNPDTILVNEMSTLTYTIDNRNGTSAATSLDFTDELPDAIRIAPTPNASTTCTSGTLTTESGNTLVIYTGGSVAAGATCTVSVDVTSLVAGTHAAESGELTSSFGPSGTAAATLNVNPPTGFTQRFDPAEIDAGETSTLTLTINNSASTVAATNITFTNTLPAEVTVVTPINVSTTCIGGTSNVDVANGIITYTGGTATAGTACSVRVAVTSDVIGVYTSTSDGVTSSLGTGNPSSANLTVEPAPSLQLSYSAAPDTVPETGGAVGFDIRVQNTSPFETLTLTNLTDDLRGNVSNEGACELPQTLDAGDTYVCFYTVIESGDGGTERTSTMIATAVDTDNNPVTAQDDTTVTFLDVPEPTVFGVYVPFLADGVAFVTDLVVSDIIISNDGIAVTIANEGTMNVVDAFWIDLYINPDPQPTAVNQIWPFLSDEGAVWGIESFTNPTQTITLADAIYVDASGTRLTDFSGVIPAGSTVCVQVDSAGDDAFGGVLEGHEIHGEAYNNITCVTVTEAVQMPVPGADTGSILDLPRPE